MNTLFMSSRDPMLDQVITFAVHSSESTASMADTLMKIRSSYISNNGYSMENRY